jgi:hypothetical protein
VRVPSFTLQALHERLAYRAGKLGEEVGLRMRRIRPRTSEEIGVEELCVAGRQGIGHCLLQFGSKPVEHINDSGRRSEVRPLVDRLDRVGG